jgi:hypothetical protein
MGDVVEMKKIRRKAKKEQGARLRRHGACREPLDGRRARGPEDVSRLERRGTCRRRGRAGEEARGGRRHVSDGRPAVPDVIGAFDGNTVDPSKSYLSTGDDLAERQARYSEAFRKWWSGVEATSENIAAFNAFVAAAGGGCRRGRGLPAVFRHEPDEGISRVPGAPAGMRPGRSRSTMRRALSQGLRGSAASVRAPDNAPLRAPYRRAGRLSADEGVADVVDPVTGTKTGSVRYDAPESVPEGFFKGMRGMGPDPFNNPSTPADRASRPLTAGGSMNWTPAGDSAQAARELTRWVTRRPLPDGPRPATLRRTASSPCLTA